MKYRLRIDLHLQLQMTIQYVARFFNCMSHPKCLLVHKSTPTRANTYTRSQGLPTDSVYGVDDSQAFKKEIQACKQTLMIARTHDLH